MKNNKKKRFFYVYEEPYFFNFKDEVFELLKYLLKKSINSKFFKFSKNN